jgi:hypothetical protein
MAWLLYHLLYQLYKLEKYAMVTGEIRGIRITMIDIRRYQRKDIGKRVLYYNNRTDCQVTVTLKEKKF